MADNLTPKEEFLLNPVEEHNITDAAIASFETNFKHPVKVTVPITPKQDLHGMPYPYPAGASVNLIPDGTDTSNGYLAGGYLNADGTTSAGVGWYVSEYFLVSAGETYMWSTNQTSVGAASTCFYDENKQYISGESANGELPKAIVAPENAVYCRTSQLTTGKLCQIEKGTVAHSIVPYSNVCPIEGLTDGKIESVGKNFLKPINDTEFWINGYINTAGNLVKRDDYRATGFIAVAPSQDYTYSVRKQDGVTLFDGWKGIAFYDINQDFIPESFKQEATFQIGHVISPSNARWVRVYTKPNTCPQFEFGSAATLYSVYQKHAIPISWKHAEGTYNFEPIQAGEGDPSPENVRPISPALTFTRDDNGVLTVYGGSITFRDDGTAAVVNDIGIDDIGEIATNLGSQDSGHPYGFFRGYTSQDKAPQNVNSFLMCSCFKTKDTGWSQNKIAIGNPSGNVIYFIDSDYTNATIEEIKEAFSGQQIAYKLATPITYILSKAETQRVIDALGDKVTTTIYGGTVTLNEDGSADVVKSWEYNIVKGTETIRVNSWASGTFDIRYSYGPDFISSGSGGAYLKCNIFKSRQGELALKTEGACCTVGGSYRYFLFRDTATFGTTVAECKEKLQEMYNNGTPLVFCAVLPTAKRTTYHFPNVGQLKAFLGQNNIWSDIGNVDVKYLTQNSATGLEYRGDRALELRRRAMIGDAPTIHTTVGSEETGGLANFKSYIKAPVKKIEIPFGPKQDLHGYDHPWPAGGGKNLLNPNDPDYGNYTIAPDGSETAGSTRISTGFIPCIVGTAYTLSGIAGANNGNRVFGFAGIAFYDINKTYLSRVFGNDVNTITATAPADAVYMRYFEEMPKVNPATPQAFVTYKRQLEAGSTATAWVPYENICPIEGQDGCMVLNGDERFNFETGVLEFDATQLGSGTPSATNYRQIVPGVNIIRDDGTQLVVYGGNIKLNDDGTSVLTDAFTVYGRKNRDGWVNNAYNHWLVYRGSDSNTLPNSEKQKSDRFYFGRIGTTIANAGSVAQSGLTWLLCCPTEEIYNIEDDTERLNAFNAWLDENPTLLYLERRSKISYNLSAEETIRAFDCLGVDASKFLRLQWNYQGDHSFTPIQDGTGDPSPENVRPINPGLTFTRDDDSVLSVYGGTLTVNADGTGSLSEEQISETIDPLLMSNNTTIQGTIGESTSIRVQQTTKLANVKSASILDKAVSGATTTSLPSGVSFLVSATWVRVSSSILGNPETKADFIDAFNAYFNNVGSIQNVYSLSEPVVYTLSVTETNRALEALGLTQHIGQIYGGTVTINPDGSADVVVDHGIHNGSALSQYPYRSKSGYINMPEMKSGNGGVRGVCSILPIQTAGGANDYSDNPTALQYGWDDTRVYLWKIGNLVASVTGVDTPTAAQIQTFLSEHNFAFTYELATPQTYHFSNLEQLKVWLGENNFWCDISDDITVKYWNRG